MSGGVQGLYRRCAVVVLPLQCRVRGAPRGRPYPRPAAASERTFKDKQVARYLGPKAKLSRREGTDLFLKSARRSISDVTPIPHNGCRPQKRRRI